MSNNIDFAVVGIGSVTFRSEIAIVFYQIQFNPVVFFILFVIRFFAERQWVNSNPGAIFTKTCCANQFIILSGKCSVGFYVYYYFCSSRCLYMSHFVIELRKFLDCFDQVFTMSLTDIGFKTC